MASAPGPDAASARRERLLEKLLLEKYEPIALVGMGLRFPGGNDTPEGFATFLREGRSGIGPIPADRWDVAALATQDASEPGRIRTEGGGWLDGIDQFDARFFNIAPKEAQFIDPQHRLVLECAWRALEHARIDPQRLKDTDAGVYVGIAGVDYQLEIESLPWTDLDSYVGTGTSHSSVAGRVSFFLGLRGPCIALDTACSSSLVTMHLAMQALRRGECSLALSGGVNLVHHPRHHIAFTRANMLAADGRCKTFDDSADGYGRSEGCGMVVLKRLSDALRDGDTVYALLRGSAIGQDGESGGLTVPNGTAQQQLMRRALDSAMLKPSDVPLIEAHGTGTPLGDPIELGAVQAVFGAGRDGQAPVQVASVKTNLGHMEAAAGVGGVIKAALQLHDGLIYPHLNLQTPSRRIPWDRMHLRVPTALQPFPDGPRRVVVNSFGFSGIIASVVMEAPPPRPAAAAVATAAPQVFALSARTPAALSALARAHAAALDDARAAGPVDLAAWCRTAATGRAHFAQRAAGVVTDADGLRAMLARWAERPAPVAEATPRAPWRVAFLCTGQGAQVPGMGRALAERFPAFAAAVDDCDRLFAPLLGRSIRALMFGQTDDPQALQQTLYTQPALFTHAWATAALWRALGVAPAAVIGHSIGELAAAAIAGVFSLPDAVRLVAARAQAMQAVKRPGGMLAVAAPAQKVAPLLEGHADIGFAAFNTPQQCVLSGAEAPLAAVREALVQAAVRVTPLPVSHAFHSVLMAEAFVAFRAAFDGVQARPPQITLVSNLDGAEATAAQLADPDHWVRQLAEPVRFAQGVQALAARGRHLMIELGPCPVLGALGRQCLPGSEHMWLASAQGQVGRAGETGVHAMLDSVARVYEAGVAVDWLPLAPAAVPAAVLPGYPFERRRVWLPAVAPRGGAHAAAPDAAHPLLGARVPDERPGHVTHERALTAAWLSLGDHAVAGQPVFPAAGHAELVLAVQDAVFGETTRAFALRVHDPMPLPTDTPLRLRTTLVARADGGAEVQVTTVVDDRERLHASATIDPRPAPPPAAEPMSPPGPTDTALAPATFYARCRDHGLDYGPAYRAVQAAWRDGDRLCATLAPPTAADAGLALPPALLDGALQTSLLLMDGDTGYLPVGIDRLVLHKKPRGPLASRLVRVEGTPGTDAVLRLDGEIVETGVGAPRHVATITGLTLRRTAASRLARVHVPRWLARALPAATATGPARQWAFVGAGRAQPLAAALADAATAQGLRCMPGSATDAPPEATDWVWCWPAQPGLRDAQRVMREAQDGAADFLAVARALAARPAPAAGTEPPRLWVVTTGAQGPTGFGPDDTLAAATAWGLAATFMNEHPRLTVRRVDLALGADGRAEVTGLVDEWAAGDAAGAEPQLAFAGGRRRVRRVVPAADALPETANFRIVPSADGQLARVRVQVLDDDTPTDPDLAAPMPDTAPGPDEVRVQVDAAGLNFKDVLNALGLLKQHAESTGQPHVPLPLGFEAAGTVLQAGADSGFAPGDPVMLNHLGAMQRRLTVPAHAVVRRPASLDAATAAAQVTAYVTAAYALHHLAGLKAGDRVLIHAAAGGVGQAAVRLALRAGATVIGTASPRKWPVLRAMGVSQVLHSRTLDFADALRPGGHGTVDLVLNSLNKEFIPAGLSTLAPGGRFVELGKVGAWTAAQVHAVRPDVAYHHFDLSEVDPAVMQRVNREILTEVATALADGSLAPVSTQTYALDELDEAFGLLARGGNTGKLVIDFRPAAAPPLPELQPQALQVVTGGFGGLGREVAAALAAAGARHLLLAGRQLPDDAERQALARSLSAAVGAEVALHAVAADVGTPDGVARLREAAAATGAPLGWVVHAAGVLDDAPLAALDDARLARVFAPKVTGGWLLHRWTAEAAAAGAPAAWIGFSSVAATLGPPGQGNYAAANAVLDTLAAWRGAHGLPARSLAWGPFAEAGMAARLTDAQARAVQDRGLRFLRPAQGMRLMLALARPGGAALPDGHALLGEVDWPRLAGSLAPNLLYALRVREAPATAAAAAAVDLDALAALPPRERALQVNALLRERIARALYLDGGDDIAPDAPFAELGLDSLVGVELVNALEAMFRISLPGSIIFDAPSVALLTQAVLDRLAPADTPAP